MLVTATLGHKFLTASNKYSQSKYNINSLSHIVEKHLYICIFEELEFEFNEVELFQQKNYHISHNRGHILTGMAFGLDYVRLGALNSIHFESIPTDSNQ